MNKKFALIFYLFPNLPFHPPFDHRQQLRNNCNQQYLIYFSYINKHRKNPINGINKGKKERYLAKRNLVQLTTQRLPLRAKFP